MKYSATNSKLSQLKANSQRLVAISYLPKAISPKPSAISYQLTVILLASLFFSCNNNNQFDASGTFEAEETIISAETTGTIKQFDIEEGQTLTAGTFIGFIDSVQLYLKKKQLEMQIQSVLSQKPNISTQLAGIGIQLQTAQTEQQRIANLVKANAATQKQLDDASAQVDIIKKQIEAQQSTLGITSSSITEQTSPIRVQIEQVNDQLAKCKIVNPVNGTVLAKYAETNEVAVQGKALYKIADISTLTLRAYISGIQLSEIKIGQQVNIFIDTDAKNYKEYQGEIYWISDKSEFTPKTIQTKDERANLVYAIKVRVKNDGFLKIGMYGEVKFK